MFSLAVAVFLLADVVAVCYSDFSVCCWFVVVVLFWGRGGSGKASVGVGGGGEICFALEKPTRFVKPF